ncbi:MAG: hypothetical protein P8Y70_05550 [Candidatus Lokiarchaeota archaeon]
MNKNNHDSKFLKFPHKLYDIYARPTPIEYSKLVVPFSKFINVQNSYSSEMERKENKINEMKSILNLAILTS